MMNAVAGVLKVASTTIPGCQHALHLCKSETQFCHDKTTILALVNVEPAWDLESKKEFGCWATCYFTTLAMLSSSGSRLGYLSKCFRKNGRCLHKLTDFSRDITTIHVMH